MSYLIHAATSKGTVVCLDLPAIVFYTVPVTSVSTSVAFLFLG